MDEKLAEAWPRERKLWTGTPANMANWMAEFCEHHYKHLPQHVFWEISRYLDKCVAEEVSRTAMPDEANRIVLPWPDAPGWWWMETNAGNHLAFADWYGTEVKIIAAGLPQSRERYEALLGAHRFTRLIEPNPFERKA